MVGWRVPVENFDLFRNPNRAKPPRAPSIREIGGEREAGREAPPDGSDRSRLGFRETPASMVGPPSPVPASRMDAWTGIRIIAGRGA